MKHISLAEAKEKGTVQLHDLLTPVSVCEKKAATDAFVIRANLIYAQFVGATAAVGAPMFICGDSAGVPDGTFEDDYDATNLGSTAGTGMGLAGAAAPSAKTDASDYGWIQTGGLNLVALTTDGNIDMYELLISSGTDGTWGGAVDYEAAGDSMNYASYHGGSSRVAGVSLAQNDSGSLLNAYQAWLRSFIDGGNLL